MKHVLVLFTDQQRYDTISAFGNSKIQTPNLDRLAADSVVFKHCITPSPVCVPARLSMMSGQYPARTGCNNNNREKVYEGKGFYSRITEQGYQSCCVGKMHYLWDPYGDIGFEKRHTQEELAEEGDEYMQYIRGKYPWVFDYNGMRSEMYYVPQISQLPAYDHPTNWVGDKSVEFINSCSGDKPMFLMASFIHPHPPYNPPSPWQKLHRDDPPEPFCPPAEDFQDFRELIGTRCSCDRLQMSRQDILRTKNYYYSCVSFVDYQLGRIIDALKAKGMYEDTLILFTSDHGDMMGDYNAIGKRSMVDASCHVPFMIHHPNHAPQKTDKVCSLVDIAPTLLSYVGADYSRDEFDGVDLFEDKGREYVYSQVGCGKSGTYMISDGRHKLVYCSADKRYYFFDKIPEEKNVYDPDNPRAAEMTVLLDSYRLSDSNHSPDSTTYEKVSVTHPHYPGRMDHTLLHNEEKNAIPAGYTIDLR